MHQATANTSDVPRHIMQVHYATEVVLERPRPRLKRGILFSL